MPASLLSKSPVGDELESSQQVVARTLAAATDLGADATVLVMGRVAFALLGAHGAGRRACLDDPPQETAVVDGLPGGDTNVRVAGLGAIQTESDDAEEILDIGLAQTRVGAGGAAGKAIETLGDTGQKRLAIHVRRPRMQSDDFLKLHGGDPSSHHGVPSPSRHARTNQSRPPPLC